MPNHIVLSKTPLWLFKICVFVFSLLKLSILVCLRLCVRLHLEFYLETWLFYLQLQLTFLLTTPCSFVNNGNFKMHFTSFGVLSPNFWFKATPRLLSVLVSFSINNLRWWSMWYELFSIDNTSTWIRLNSTYFWDHWKFSLAKLLVSYHKSSYSFPLYPIRHWGYLQ